MVTVKIMALTMVMAVMLVVMVVIVMGQFVVDG